jgi:hypothetical protein
VGNISLAFGELPVRGGSKHTIRQGINGPGN